ncbi:unnamed protein product [Urochloa decumbens]|uniref:Uncharacterized protein n=1 Tax=Urochloa decumbens TaxID=240449 RepID=A0ABC9DXA8_9POAL
MWAAARRWVVNRLAPASSTMLSGPLMKMKKDSKKHLYLVLDDLNRGCSVHKLDIQEDDGGGGLGRQLLEDPVTRLHFPTLGNDPHVGVLGSHVVGIGSGSPTAWPPDPRDGVTVAFDLKTAALTVLRDLPTGRRRHYDVHLMLAVGNRRMYMIESGTGEYKHGSEPCAGAMHCLEHIAGDGDGGGGDDDQGRWDWWDFPCLEQELSSLMRWRWNEVHDRTPFHADGIMAHALHPGGRAFFVSLHDWWTDGRDDDRRGTFSYDTGSKERRGRWARHGGWELPFAGQAHYDAHLAAWLGLHLHLYSGHGFHMDGYLCTCDVPPLQDGSGASTPAPAWKLSNEQLFHVDPERHIDAKIVPIDGGFCLVEILTREGVHRDDCLGDGDKCVLRLTTFRAKYAPDGELTIAARRPAGHYYISRYIDMFQMQAFWM